jgi:hypothetical protein
MFPGWPSLLVFLFVIYLYAYGTQLHSSSPMRQCHAWSISLEAATAAEIARRNGCGVSKNPAHAPAFGVLSSTQATGKAVLECQYVCADDPRICVAAVLLLYHMDVAGAAPQNTKPGH